MLLLQGKALTGVLSAQVVAVANAVLGSMAVNRITAYLGTALLVGVVGVVAAGYWGNAPAPDPVAPDAQGADVALAVPPAPPAPPAPKTVPAIQVDPAAPEGVRNIPAHTFEK